MSSVQSEDYEEVIRESSEEEDEMDSQPFFGSEDPSEEEDQDDDVDDLGMRVGTALAVRNDAPENLQLVTYSAEYENLLRNAEKLQGIASLPTHVRNTTRPIATSSIGYIITSRVFSSRSLSSYSRMLERKGKMCI